jgi:hypothetical protein
MGVMLFRCSGRQIEQQQNYKNKIQSDLRWPPFDVLHATTNQKHADMTEKRCDRTRNQAEMLEECDTIVFGAIELGGEKTKKKHLSLRWPLF